MGTSRERADYYTKKARQEGYPARSVYKLEEIQQKYRILNRGDCVLDVGAAPGSWTLYTHRKLLKGSGKIVAVDLKPLELPGIPAGVVPIVGDAFSPENQREIASHGPFDAIISDAAPATTGNRSVDTLRSQQLAESVLALASEHLKTHGNLVVKLFQGGGEQELLKLMRTVFMKVKPFKPKACRSESFEIFLIGLDRRE